MGFSLSRGCQQQSLAKVLPHAFFFYELAYIVDGMAVRVLGHSGNKKTKKVKRNKMKI
jgi:hypothetical protein